MTRINDALAARMDRIRRGEKNDAGFTLIELLVVIIIIGILAAIAIPVFLNQRQSAWKTQVISDVHQATLAVETYGTANNGSFAGLLASEVHVGTGGTGTATASPKVSFTVSPGDTITVAQTGSAGSYGYSITGTNVNLGTGTGFTYTYSNSTGTGAWS